MKVSAEAILECIDLTRRFGNTSLLTEAVKDNKGTLVVIHSAQAQNLRKPDTDVVSVSSLKSHIVGKKLPLVFDNGVIGQVIIDLLIENDRLKKRIEELES